MKRIAVSGDAVQKKKLLCYGHLLLSFNPLHMWTLKEGRSFVVILVISNLTPEGKTWNGETHPKALNSPQFPFLSTAFLSPGSDWYYLQSYSPICKSLCSQEWCRSLSQQKAPGGPKIKCGSSDDDDDAKVDDGENDQNENADDENDNVKNYDDMMMMMIFACQERESDVGDVGLHWTSWGGPEGTENFLALISIEV